VICGGNLLNEDFFNVCFYKAVSFENFFAARRTMELLTQNWNLSKKLRIPAISRLQKMHNVDIVLQVLKSRGIQLSDEHGKGINVKLLLLTDY
jgi:abnormal spindle-like microcephaly-associated protein